MAQLKEILEIESVRGTFDAQRVIHLFPEGAFLRAYEWSAWLCCRYFGPLKATHRNYKNVEQSVVFVGFPQSSLAKFVPEGSEVVANDDKSFDVFLEERLFPMPEDREAMRTDYDNWKRSQPISQSQSQKETGSGILTVSENHSGVSMTSIIQSILSFPVERKSPIDCMLFLAELKRQSASLV